MAIFDGPAKSLGIRFLGVGEGHEQHDAFNVSIEGGQGKGARVGSGQERVCSSAQKSGDLSNISARRESNKVLVDVVAERVKHGADRKYACFIIALFSMEARRAAPRGGLLGGPQPHRGGDIA